MTLRALIAAVLAAAVFPAAAAGATIHEDLEASHRYWRSDVCRGQWQVVADSTLPARGAMGAATGLGYTHNPTSGAYEANGTRWDWHVARCEFTMDPAIRGRPRRCVVAHEMGHFIHGPAHAGPMEMGLWHKCLAIADALDHLEAQAYERRVRQHRHKTRKVVG